MIYSKLNSFRASELLASRQLQQCEHHSKLHLRKWCYLLHVHVPTAHPLVRLQNTPKSSLASFSCHTAQHPLHRNRTVKSLGVKPAFLR